MNPLDIIILVIVLIPVLFGIRKGLLRSIFSLVGIVSGLFLATRYNDVLVTYLNFLKLDDKLTGLISFIAIIIICYLISVFAAGKLSGINVITKTFDRLFGGIFGVFKGLILASLFLLITTNTFNIFTKNTIEKSKFSSSVVNIAPDVYNFLQQYFPNARDFYDELNHIIFKTN